MTLHKLIKQLDEWIDYCIAHPELRSKQELIDLCIFLHFSKDKMLRVLAMVYGKSNGTNPDIIRLAAEFR